MGEDHDQQVLHYERVMQRPSRRPDVLFGRLAAGCLGLLSSFWVMFVTLRVEPPEPMAILAFALWPAGIVLAILGLVFDRRWQWVSSAVLIVNIVTPVILLAVSRVVG